MNMKESNRIAAEAFLSPGLADDKGIMKSVLACDSGQPHKQWTMSKTRGLKP